MATASNWKSFAGSPSPWERDALEFVRERFPTHEPYRAWSLFELITPATARSTRSICPSSPATASTASRARAGRAGSAVTPAPRRGGRRHGGPVRHIGSYRRREHLDLVPHTQRHHTRILILASPGHPHRADGRQLAFPPLPRVAPAQGCPCPFLSSVSHPRTP